MSESRDPAPAQGWHIAPWPPLAWAETIIKLIALAIGIVALLGAVAVGGFVLPEGMRLVQWIVFIVLSLGLLAAILDRIIDREIVAMVFVIINNVGHWGMVLALTSPAFERGYLVAFAALMLAGDVVKLVFLRVHNFRVRDFAPRVVYGLTLFYIAGYALLLALELAG